MNTASTPQEVIRYLNDRLPQNCNLFNEEHIKVSDVWFNFLDHKEKKPETEGAEDSRKITIERRIPSKIKESIFAFFSGFFSVEKERYKVDQTAQLHIDTAVGDLFSEIALEQNNNAEKIKKVYVNCIKLEFWVSKTNEENTYGPIASECKGIKYSLNAGKISQKSLAIITTMISLILDARRVRIG